MGSFGSQKNTFLGRTKKFQNGDYNNLGLGMNFSKYFFSRTDSTDRMRFV